MTHVVYDQCNLDESRVESRCETRRQHPRRPCAPNKNRAPLQHAALKSAAPNSEAAAGRGGLDGVDEEAGTDEDEQRDAHARAKQGSVLLASAPC